MPADPFSPIALLQPEDGGSFVALVSLMAAGLTDTAIARRMGISERTVRRRVAQLLSGLGASSRFQAGIIFAPLLQQLAPDGEPQPGG